MAAKIDNDKCISCGACVFMCPFGAIMEKCYVLDVIDLIKKSNNNENYKVYAVVAPAIASQFNYAKVGQVIHAIKELGFHTVVEAALGADIVAKAEAAELVEKGFLTTSCCPSFVDYMEKEFPDMLEFVSHNPSPMAAIGKYIKEKDPSAKVVFIGPCVAKKKEVQRDEVAPYVDVVLTFQELQALLDSSFLYFFGQERDGLAGVIDVDDNESYLLGDDIDIDDIIWYGSVDSVADMAASVGVEKSGAFGELAKLIAKAQEKGRKIHFLPPYRYDHKILLEELLGIKPECQKESASLELIHAVVDLRSTKTKEEISEIEKACAIGYKMHTTAMKLCRPGVTERFISGMITGIAESFGSMVSFANIVSMHGEIMHGCPSDNSLEYGRLMLCDAGAETVSHYCSDNTRTTPISGKFTTKQREIYTIVEQCHDLAQKMAAPGVKWKDVHMAVCRHIIECMKALGLMKGDTDEALAAGAHALFLPHGLGHMMGMDVHDMEGLGQQYVGFDDEVRPSSQFGLASLRISLPEHSLHNPR